jgi:uncharacterized protein YlxP (DUF503 family)
VTIGVYTFEIHLPDSRSLKQRRQVLRRLKDRLRSRYNVAVGEIGDHSDLWQRAGVVVVSVASRREALEKIFEGVHREAESQVPGQIIETGSEFIEGADGGPGGWGEDWE